MAATSVVGAGWPDLGVSSSRRFAEVREARRQLGDRALQGEGERVALRSQGLQPGVVEVLVPKRRFSGGQRRPRLVEVEPMGLLRAGAAERRTRAKARTTQRSRRNADAGFITG